jgi:hypothetical protein
VCSAVCGGHPVDISVFHAGELEAFTGSGKIPEEDPAAKKASSQKSHQIIMDG